MYRLLVVALLLAAPAAGAQTMTITTRSDAARDHFDQGRDRISHANFAAARAHFDAALAADPGFGLAHMYRAIATAEGRDEQMRLAASARVSPGERQMIDAWAAHLRDDHGAELALLGAVAEAFPDDPYPPFHMGWELLNQDRYGEATTSFRRTLAIDPTFGGAYNLMGYTAIAAEDDASAERAFREYMRVSPDEANPYDSYGEFLLINGRLDEAVPQFERALAIDPEFTASRDNLIRIDILRAVDAYEAAMQSGNPDAIVDLHAAGAVVLPSAASLLRGRDALAAYFGAQYDQASPVELESQQIVVAASGDLAYDIGATSWPGGTGKYMTVYRRIGGRWLIVADSWNGDAPAATAAAASD